MNTPSVGLGSGFNDGKGFSHSPLNEKKGDGWPKKLEKGRFTEYCKRMGFKGPNEGCADKAMDSNDSSVRGMASFWKNTTKKNPKTK